jgi:hypothetical protein
MSSREPDCVPMILTQIEVWRKLDGRCKLTLEADMDRDWTALTLT